MVAIPRRKRMVAQNIAEVPFLFAVTVRRRTFFQEDPSIMFLTLALYITPPDKVEVEPCFVVATLISRAQAKRLHEEWRMHREAELSSADPIQAVQGTHRTRIGQPAKNRPVQFS